MLEKIDFESAPTALPYEALAALADASVPNSTEGVCFVGPCSPDFSEKIISGWMRFPETVREFLVEEEFKLVAAQTAGRALPNMAQKQIWKNDLYGRTHMDHAGGLYLNKNKKAVLAEFIWARKEQPSVGANVTEESILQRKWILQAKAEIVPTVYHEVWHAIDHLAAHVLGAGLVSSWGSFQAAYCNDLRELGGREAAEDRGYAYYVTEGNAGSFETFAEIGSEIMGKSLAGPRMIRDWPQSTNFIRSFYRELHQAGNRGGQGIYAYLKTSYEREEALYPSFSFSAAGQALPSPYRPAPFSAGKSSFAPH
jgi:hypothetical protein